MPQAIGLAIGSFLFNLGASIAVVNFAVFTLGPALFRVGLSLALSLVSNALLRGHSPLPTPSDGQSEIKQPLSPRFRYYGQVRVSGVVWWLDAIDDVLFLGLALNHGRIGSIVARYIDENHVDVDGSDKVTTVPYSANDVYIHSRLGLTPETKYSEIFDNFGTDDVRGDGVATLLATIQNPSSAATFSTTYPNGRPLVRVTMQASVVYDPRDSTQVQDDSTTWQYSNNLATCLMDYVTSADGYGIPWALVEANLDEWIEAMDVCDEPIDLLTGGTTPRYTVAGGYRLTDDPADVIAKFCATGDARVWVKRDGSIGVSVGKFVAPTVSLSDKHVAGYSDLLMGQDPVRAVEGIRAEFMSPDHDYREHEAEPWPTGAEVAELSEDRTLALDLTWVSNVSQSRRLMKRAFARAQAPWHGTVMLNAAGLQLIDERFFNLIITEIGLDTSLEILGFSFDPTALMCQVDVVQVDSTIDDWDSSEEGIEEGGTFDLFTTYDKTGTTLNILTEAGGDIGQTAVVFAASTASPAATPAGWDLIDSDESGGSLGIALYTRVLDGTETAATFLGSSGAIIALIYTAAGTLITGDLVTQVTSSEPASQELDAITTPFAVLSFAAANSDFDHPDWINWSSDGFGKVIVSSDGTVVHRTGSLTAQARYRIYAANETPDPKIYIFVDDEGVNGLMSLHASPSE